MPINPGFELPFGIQPTNPVPVDAWSGPFTAGSLVAGVSAANAAIPSAVRFQSMEVRLIVGGVSYKYWYANGIADIDLVAFNAEPTNYVISFNGLTGAVTGVTTGVSNTFIPIQSFSGGITTNGITSTGNIIHVSSGSSFINDQVFLGGVTSSNVIIGTSGHLTNAEVRVMSDEGTVGITSTGDITIGTANGVINFIGNLNITGQVLVNGAIITKTGFYGFTGDSDEEPVDYVTLDGGQF